MVIKYILLILGIFETVTNLFHISKRTVEGIGQSAKKQHQELPLSLSGIHFYYKAIIMLIFGLVFLSAGIISLLDFSFAFFVTDIVVLSFGIYGIIQAFIYSQEKKVWMAMLVYNIPLVINYLKL